MISLELPDCPSLGSIYPYFLSRLIYLIFPNIITAPTYLQKINYNSRLRLSYHTQDTKSTIFSFAAIFAAKTAPKRQRRGRGTRPEVQTVFSIPFSSLPFGLEILPFRAYNQNKHADSGRLQESLLPPPHSAHNIYTRVFF